MKNMNDPCRFYDVITERTEDEEEEERRGEDMMDLIPAAQNGFLLVSLHKCHISNL